MNGSKQMHKADLEAAMRADKAKGKGNWPDVVAGYIKSILSAVGPVQWEYRCFAIASFPEEMLNQSGKEGWELVTVLSHHNNASVVEELYIMKRLVRNRKPQGTDHE